MNVRLLLAIGFVSTSTLLFQNCGEVSFTPNGDFALVEKAEGEDSFVDPVDDLIDGSGPDLTDNTDHSIDDPDTLPEEEKECDKEKKDSNRPPVVSRDEDQSEDQLGLVYKCILEGPGKSKNLGVVNIELFKNGNTPDTVCMSKSACEEIVSQKFSVKEAKFAGFCGKNPHTVQLSDERLQELVNQI